MTQKIYDRTTERTAVGSAAGEHRQYDAVIFDLDGTLLDTLDDLTDSVNAVLQPYGMPRYSLEQVRSFVGNGIRRLMQLTVPGGEAEPRFEEIYRCFQAYYGSHCMDRTEPYPGIMHLLEWLRRLGVSAAIVSNKSDFAVKKLRDVYFGNLIAAAVGEREGCRKKPAPDSVFQALEKLHVSRERAVYVGDSEVDIETARNAGMDFISVSWGFRGRDFLMEHGAAAEQIAANVNELKQLLIRNPENETGNFSC